MAKSKMEFADISGGRHRMKKSRTVALTLVGISWAFIGMGYMSIQFHYLPEGAALVTETLGLFIAGFLSGAILLSVVENMQNRLGRWLVVFGYLLFAPLGIMAGLLAPGAYEPVEVGSSITFAVLAPVLITITAVMAVGLGIGFTGGVAVAAHRIINRE
jgi:hypothetical protein